MALTDDTQLADRPAVLLSGGQDSATCLAWACASRDDVAAISFDYDQRHGVELIQAERIARWMDVPHVVLEIPALAAIGAASLTNPDIESDLDATDTGNVYAEAHGLPSSFVPARNALLLSTAAAWAAPNGYDGLVVGVCEADEAGYPDCREPFIDAMTLALQMALDEPGFTIAAPLLHLDKGRTFAMANALGVLSMVVESTHTCYEGDHTTRHPWGYGCGECPACRTRATGWEQFLAAQVA